MSPEIYILEQSGGYGQCCGINHTKGNHRSPSRSTPHKSPAADPHPSALASSAARVVSLINNRGQRERAMLPALLAGLAPRSQHCLPARPQRHKILSPTPSRRDLQRFLFSNGTGPVEAIFAQTTGRPGIRQPGTSRQPQTHTDLCASSGGPAASLCVTAMTWPLIPGEQLRVRDLGFSQRYL